MNDRLTIGDAYRFHSYLRSSIPPMCSASLIQFQPTHYGGVYLCDGETPELATWDITIPCPSNGDVLLLIIALVPRGGAEKRLCSWGKYDIDERKALSNGFSQADEYVQAVRKCLIKGAQMDLADPSRLRMFIQDQPRGVPCDQLVQ